MNPLGVLRTRSIYLIGSLRNPEIPRLAMRLRSHGHDVFDDWYAAGPEADDKWMEYEIARGRTYEEAIRGEAAGHVYQFDKRHLDRCDTAVLLMPCGRSGHLEFGRFIGIREAIGAPVNAFVCFPVVPERYDVMYRMTTKVCIGADELVKELT